MFRLDDTIERAEVVLGGPGVVFSTASWAPRRTSSCVRARRPAWRLGRNPRLGRAVPARRLLRRAAGAGLVREHRRLLPRFDGIRKSQFPADDGGQLTATLTHTMDQGTIMFYARVLNDKNLFITDIPVTVSGSGKNQSVSGFPGFNPITGRFAGDGMRGLSVQEAPGRRRSPRTLPMAAARTSTCSATISTCSSPTRSLSATR